LDWFNYVASDIDFAGVIVRCGRAISMVQKARQKNWAIGPDVGMDNRNWIFNLEGSEWAGIGL